MTAIELARSLIASDKTSRTEYGDHVRLPLRGVQPVARALVVLHDGLVAFLEEDPKTTVGRFEATRVTSVTTMQSRIRHLLARAYEVAECDLDERGEPVRF